MVKCLECFRYGNPCKGGPIGDHKCNDFTPFGRPDKMTIEDHAIAWHKENGRTMKPNDEKMYKEWVEWAFSDFRSE